MDAIPPTTTYTWVITSVKGNREDAKKCATANCVVQANEVVFYDTDGNELGGEYHTATVTGDAGVVTKPSEGPDKLFDMKTNTKFLDSAFAFETSITFEFPFEIALGGMAFLTGGEWIARDPDSWKVYAHYETGDEEVQNIEMAGVTDDRLALTKMFPFTAPAGGAMEPGSIVNDSPVANLDGWTKVYEEVYGAYTVLGDIELCNGYDHIFVGAKANVGADHIILGASEDYSFVDSLSAQTCDKASGFKNPDSPDGAYWHNCVDWSFGFTPTEIVQLNSADVYDMADENRLSWHLHGNVGGFRIGTIGWINNDQTYAKVIYCK